MTKLTSPHHGELLVHADAERLAVAATELFVRCSSEAMKAHGQFYVALSGGSTPRTVYELLASTSLRRRVNWSGIEFFWGDERYVPVESRESNYRMTYETLLRHVPVPPTNIHRVLTELGPPDASAAAYELELRQVVGDSAGIPQLDLIFLGLGTNGHTASLFPHSPALHATKELVVADFVSEGNGWRLSMTAPLLNRGRTVAFLVSGKEKAAVLRDVLLGPRDPERLPAQLIVPEGRLLWIADEAAASLLPALEGRQSA